MEELYMDEPIRVMVPQQLVVEYLEHPEEYGDYVVVLENGMWTDVYKDEDGKLYTTTNDLALIDYLSSWE